MLNGEVVKHTGVLGREGEIGDGTPPFEQPRTDAVTNSSRKRVHHHIRRVFIHHFGGGRNVEGHHTRGTSGQSGCICIDRSHVMTVCGQGVRNPSTDQSSAENKHTPHELVTTPNPFILTPPKQSRGFSRLDFDGGIKSEKTAVGP